jgi:hypothetical protein
MLHQQDVLGELDLGRGVHQCCHGGDKALMVLVSLVLGNQN